MKRFIHIVVVLVVAQTAIAQNIAKIEYFFNTDPGFGKANPLTGFPASNNVVNWSANIPLTNVPNGINTLFIRVCDANGLWSLSNYNAFIKTNLAIPSAIQQVEYFFNTDPGFGKGQSLKVPKQNKIDSLPLLLDVTQIPNGINNLFIRVQDSTGVWSITNSTAFLKNQANYKDSIVAVEYVIDSIVDFGKGTLIPIIPVDTLKNYSYTIPLQNVSNGIHTLFIRAKNKNGIWSLTNTTPFLKASINATNPIIKAEYFFDTDPGFNKGYSFVMPSVAANIQNITIPISTCMLNKGQHKVFIRSIDSLGNWSLTNLGNFTVNNYYQPTNSVINLQGCGSVIYKGISYSSNTSFRDTIKSYFGCDSIYATVNITLTNNDVSGRIVSPKNYANINFSTPATASLQGGVTQTQLCTNGYSFTCLPNNANVVVRLSKNNDKNKTNGINTIDIALTQSHILQKAILNSPYKIIAADVNDDKKVTALDVVFMKRLILGIDTIFPKKRLWAFVDSSYSFSTPNNPFPYKDSISFTGLNASQTNQTFIGMKLGDVNWDWNANLPKGIVLPTVELSYEFKVEGSKIKVPVYIKNFKAMQGIQYTLNFDNKMLRYLGIINKVLPFEFNVSKAQEGKISMLWIDEKNEVRTLEDGTLVFELEFENISNEPIGSSTNQPIIYLSNDITEVLAIDGDLNRYNVVLKPTNINTPPITNINAFSIYPNPAKDKLIISTDAKQAQISISNELGKQFKQQKVLGQTTIDVSKLAKGVYFISFISDKGVSTQTFIKE